MTFEEALKLAKFERGQFDSGEVAGARDCGDRWAFTFKADVGQIGMAPAFVFKDSGKCEFFFMTCENVDILMNGTPIELPKEPEDD